MPTSHTPALAETYQHWAHLASHFQQLAPHMRLFTAPEQAILVRKQIEAAEKAAAYQQKLMEHGTSPDAIGAMQAEAQRRAKASSSKTVQFKLTSIPFAMNAMQLQGRIDVSRRNAKPLRAARDAQQQLDARATEPPKARGIAPKSHTQYAEHGPAGSGYLKR